MSLSNLSKTYLNETRKWTRFLAIVGFVMLAIMIVAGFSMSSIMSAFGADDFESLGFATGIPYLFMGALYFFPIYYLYKFSTNIKAALYENNEGNEEKAFENLKSHYKFMGIFVIVMLAFYLFFGIGMLMLGSAIFNY